MLVCHFEHDFLPTNTPQIIVETQQMNIREKAQQQAAMELGIQTGLYLVSQKITQQLDQLSAGLYQIYDFNALMLDNHILPPIIQSSYHNIDVLSDSNIIATELSYSILQADKLALSAPIWRDYLVTKYTLPEMPDASLLPQKKEEKERWDATIDYACTLGFEQGLDIFKQNVRRLTRDYTGMILYHRLALEHILSKPYAAKYQYGIKSNATHLTIDQSSLKLENYSKFQDNSLWTPVIATGEKQ